MNITDLLKEQFSNLEKKIVSSQGEAEKYERYASFVQGFALFMGIITPFIVIFRKNAFLPQSFWLLWCIITPPLTAIITVLSNHFEVKGRAIRFAQMHKKYLFLAEKAKLRFATAKSEDEKKELYEFIMDKIHVIEE